MIRIIVKVVGLAPEGAHMDTIYKTFDIDAPALEKYLSESGAYRGVTVVGAEPLPAPPGKERK